tara:strand:- start:299954 stop:300685 length:732 start_codon:yes stop_codon:yes gene_type:complete
MTNILEETTHPHDSAPNAMAAPPLLPEQPAQLNQTAVRPAGLPEKFWDAEKGEVRLDALLRSYQALEQRFSRGERDIPDSPEGYCVECGEFEPDPQVNAVLHKARFSNDQAQVVYDLARHYVAPELAAARSNLAAENVRGRLEEYFGGKERWSRIAQQLGDWGKAHLPEDVMDALSGSFEGVLALHRMMASDEPGVGTSGIGGGDGPDEQKLKKLMQDPRYWRDQDPALIAKVRNGFQRLYPS